MALTLYAMIAVTLASLDLRNYQPPVMSLYLQLVAIISLRGLRVDNINFEVYKKDQLAA